LRLLDRKHLQLPPLPGGYLVMTFLAAGQRAPPASLVLSNTERKDKIQNSRKGKKYD
jgi:hypothetical protein